MMRQSKLFIQKPITQIYLKVRVLGHLLLVVVVGCTWWRCKGMIGPIFGIYDIHTSSSILIQRMTVHLWDTLNWNWSVYCNRIIFTFTYVKAKTYGGLLVLGSALPSLSILSKSGQSKKFALVRICLTKESCYHSQHCLDFPPQVLDIFFNRMAKTGCTYVLRYVALERWCYCWLT